MATKAHVTKALNGSGKAFDAVSESNAATGTVGRELAAATPEVLAVRTCDVALTIDGEHDR